MPEPIIARFDDPAAVEEALHSLKELGVEGLRITSPAAYPVTEETGRPPLVHRLGWLATGGALLGLASAIALQAYVSLSEPLIVSGKPVLSWPAFTIVMFELTLLFAGLVTFVSVVVLTGVARRRVPKAARVAVFQDRIALVVPAAKRSKKDKEAILSALDDAAEVSS